MDRREFLIVAGTVAMLAACNPETVSGPTGEPVNFNLNCAAMIGAATKLRAQGQIETNEEFMGQALVSTMTHLNSYAIPRDIREPDAFAEVEALQVGIFDTLSPAQIYDRAQSCIRRTPRVG